MQILLWIMTLGVLFVNGWTDAPNAIAAAISTGALSMRKGVLLAAGMNALGGCAAMILGQKVAETVFYLGEFSPDAAGTAALAAAMLAVILWAVIAWRFGIPTSESHGLMAGIMGAALAQRGGGISMVALGRVAVGLVLSVGLGFILGWLLAQLFRQWNFPPRLWRGGQIVSAALMAFTHGLQDTPKFASMLLLAQGGEGFALPLWILLGCSGVMSLGTLLGGGRIIQTVGNKMVHLTEREGFAADLAGSISLLLSTLQGLPVSTTHAKTCAMMGAAEHSVNGRVAGSMFAAWLLTFPACGILGFLLTKAIFLFAF